MRTEGRATVVAVTGELDLASSPELEQRLEQFYASESELLVIDLRGLEFMDSTGLSVLVSAHHKLIDAGRRLIIVRGPQQVQRLLDLTGVAERLELVDTPDEVLTEG
jgi:anti-sigma B factor antagonist